MKTTLRQKTIIYLLLLLFVIQGGVGYWVLQHKIWLVKREMKALVMGNVEEQKLTHINLSKQEFEDLEWPEPWEFLYKGKMYDISKKEFHSDGSVTLHAVLDGEENDLKALVRKLVNNSSEKKQTKDQLDFFFKNQSHWVCETIENITSLFTSTKSFPSITLFNISSDAHLRRIDLPPILNLI